LSHYEFGWPAGSYSSGYLIFCSMDLIVNKCLDCTIKSKAVACLSSDELHLLNHNCIIQPVKRGETAQYVVYIREGFIKQSKKDTSGKEHIIDIANKGSYVGLHNILPGTRNNYISATSIKESQVCLIGIRCFEKLLKSNGEFATRVLSYVCENELFFVKRLLNNQEQNLFGRLADALLYFRNAVYRENPFHLDMTRDELASFIGSSRESVTRALKNLHDENIIVINHQMIHLLDEQKLKQLSQKG
jgi:CRP-like cAMP-binding protein